MKQKLRQYFSVRLVMAWASMEAVEEIFRCESDSNDTWNKCMILSQLKKQHNRIDRLKFVLKIINRHL